MIKRYTRFTGLLVIAASIVSMVPAIGAEVPNIEVKEAIVHNAMSKGGGIFIIDAELNDKDEAIYCYKEGKYTKLDDAKPTDELSDLCQNKYLEMRKSDGNLYYVDITNGKETDEFDREIDNREIAIKLKNKIKDDNDGRFSEDNYTNHTVIQDCIIGGATTTWSQYTYKLKEANLLGNQNSEIYADRDGNYIDADYNLGSIKVYTTTGSSVTVKNTEDTYKVKEEDGHTYEIKAQIKAKLQYGSNVNNSPYCENLNDFYRPAELSIWKRDVDSDSEYVNVTDEVEFGPQNNHHHISVSSDSNYGDYVTVIQTISKEQASDTIDGIKYPKNVKTYFVTNKDGEDEAVLGLGTSDKAGNAIMSGNPEGLQSLVVDDSSKNLYVEAVNFRTKGGYNYIDVGSMEETSYDVFTIGSGQIFCTNGAYLKKWNNKDSFDKLYKVDSGMTNLSSNDPGDMILWNQDKEEYSIISIPPTVSAEANTAAPAIEMSTTTAAEVRATAQGWTKNNDGTWSYIKADGAKASGWLQDGVSWYYLKDNVIMATGWQNVGGIWYYLNNSGAMQTGWINDNGTWYYCNTSGEMLTDTVVEGYVLAKDGAWIR